jgi:hypothetical protein
MTSYYFFIRLPKQYPVKPGAPSQWAVRSQYGQQVDPLQYCEMHLLLP